MDSIGSSDMPGESVPVRLAHTATSPAENERSHHAGATTGVMDRAGDGLAVASMSERPCHDETVLRTAFAAARMGVWECSLPGEALNWSEGVYDLFELPRGAPPDRGLTLTCYEPETRAQLISMRADAIRNASGFEHDAQIITAGGTMRWIRITATVETKDGIPSRIFGIKRDITEERRLLERTRHLAEHDVLTGLKNRLAFNARMESLAEAPGDPASATTLLLLDLDCFKAVNDGAGHQIGDEVLQTVGERIRAACTDSVAHAFIARVGGDEFAILLEDRGQAAERLAQAIVTIVANPLDHPAISARIGVSISIARLHGRDVARLYREADMALYEAKAAGRGQSRTFCVS